MTYYPRNLLVKEPLVINIDYWETDEGQFLAGAHRYISAARVLRYSQEAKAMGNALQTPTLHLLCHGIELLFKFPLIRSGASQADVSKRYRHDLDELWQAKENCLLRHHCIAAAADAWEEARDSGRWPDDDFSDEPAHVLTHAVHTLSKLHGKTYSFALRYTLPTRLIAPRPAFLIDAFGRVAEATVKNPSFLDR